MAVANRRLPGFLILPRGYSVPAGSDWQRRETASGRVALCLLCNTPTHKFTFGQSSRNIAPELSVLMQLGLRSSKLTDLLVIMVVEDDQEVQALVEDALTDGGFEAAIAASGEEAVTLIKGNRSHYCALVIDIGLLGRMNGWEVATQAREIDPALPVIYMTGGAADQWASQGVTNSVLLTKPFAPAQLVTAISNLLNIGTKAT